MRSVVGKSGVIHQFIEVELSQGGDIEKVVDALETACDVEYLIEPSPGAQSLL